MSKIHGRKDVGELNTTNMNNERKFGKAKDMLTYFTSPYALVSFIEDSF